MNKIFTILIILFSTSSFSQVVVRTYWDIFERQIKEEYHTDPYGTRNGLYKMYSQYGGILSQGSFKDDLPIGKWIDNNYDGKLKTITFFTSPGTGWFSVVDGKIISYYENGKTINSIKNYKNSQLDGEYKEYDESGVLIEEGNYVNGVFERTGESKRKYDEDQAEKEKLIAEKERLRLEKLQLEKKIDSIYNLGISSYNNNKIREANEYFSRVLSLDPNHLKSIALNQEINQFFMLRTKGFNYKYRDENQSSFSNLSTQIRKLVDEEIIKSKTGDFKINIVISFDTLGKNNSYLINGQNNEFSSKIKEIIQDSNVKPLVKYGYFLNTTDVIDLSVSWSTTTEYVESTRTKTTGADLISGADEFFKSNPVPFKNFIENLEYRYGNFTFEVKNKNLTIDNIRLTNQNISLVKYKLNSGPKYAFLSLLLPGWGSSKVSNYEFNRGFLPGFLYVLSIGSAGGFLGLEYLGKANEGIHYTTNSDGDVVQSENSSFLLKTGFYLSLGVAGATCIYDFSWSLIKGFQNVKKSSSLKKKLKEQPVEVLTTKFEFQKK